jgi:Ca-activated chloride channel family protein
MSFTWPLLLFGALAGPALIAIHLWLLRRRRRGAVVVIDAALIRAAVPRSSTIRRHLAAALLAVAVTVAAVAAARPTRVVTVSLSQSSILLALDASQSMCNVDIEPNRLAAAQDAAVTFVDGLDTGAQVGLVIFNGLAALTVPSTGDTDQVVSAIESITVSPGTAIGAAILVAIDAIAENNPDVASTNVELGDATASASDDAPSRTSEDRDYQPEIIVVLTDGANSRGVNPTMAAAEAAARGLRVYTIGFGSTSPGASSCTSAQLGTAAFGDGEPSGAGPGGGPSGRNFREIDEETLAAVAKSTGAEYFRAEDAQALVEIFAELPSRVDFTTREHEITVWFALAAAALSVMAMAACLVWNRTS